MVSGICVKILKEKSEHGKGRLEETKLINVGNCSSLVMATWSFAILSLLLCTLEIFYDKSSKQHSKGNACVARTHSHKKLHIKTVPVAQKDAVEGGYGQ